MYLPRIFWDQDGILLFDYLPKGQTINAEYYSSLLVQLKDILKQNRREKVTKGVLFLHDNAPAHLQPRRINPEFRRCSLFPSWSGYGLISTLS